MTATLTSEDEVAMRPAERQAIDLLLAAWHRSPDGGFQIPVDPFHIAGKLGIDVYAAELESDVSGMLVKEPGQDASIFVNSEDAWNRQRFSCAHEIGHFVLRSSSRSDDSFGYVDRRGPSASQGTNPSEVYANQFAAELLMPQENVRACAQQMSDAALAVMFEVSVGAMKYRLENLGIRRR